jgi:succinate dehydrogenase/fumarate reductase-like Fe-S protein
VCANTFKTFFPVSSNTLAKVVELLNAANDSDTEEEDIVTESDCEEEDISFMLEDENGAKCLETLSGAKSELVLEFLTHLKKIADLMPDRTSKKLFIDIGDGTK